MGETCQFERIGYFCLDSKLSKPDASLNRTVYPRLLGKTNKRHAKTTIELHQKHFCCPYYAFAPGRIEFIGNHTDYNGGLVMGAAVTEGITVAVSLRDDAMIRIVSDAAIG